MCVPRPAIEMVHPPSTIILALMRHDERVLARETSMQKGALSIGLNLRYQCLTRPLNWTLCSLAIPRKNGIIVSGRQIMDMDPFG